MGDLVDRVRAARTAVARTTLAPLVVRGGIFLCVLAGFAVALPAPLLTSRLAGLLVVAAAFPAFAPRSRWPTITALVTVAGWLLATSRYDQPIVLWKLLALATFLYLAHSLAALAALLPYDVVLAPDVPGRWLIRAVGVVLASAVLSVLLLSASGGAGERSLLVAALGGLATAVLVAVLLTWLARRD
nr:hypothetical protein [Micromonospora sp. DSM 115978]